MMKLFHDVDLCWISFYAQGAQRLLFEIHHFLQLETLCVFVCFGCVLFNACFFYVLCYDLFLHF